MILSEKHKFIFIKGLKVAGTSVEILLSEICGPSDIITPLGPSDERTRLLNGINAAQNYEESSKEISNYLPILKNSTLEQLNRIKRPESEYYNHMPLSELVNLYGEIPNDWLIFGIERCPYRKIISYANFRLKTKEYNVTGKPMISALKTLKKYLQEIIDNESVLKVKNIGLYRDNEGSIKAKLLRFERLEEDIMKLMLKLKIKSYPKLEHYKKGISSNELDLHDIFTKNQINKINELFEDEFNCFGYDMI
jgi:hypothetical protein